MTWAALAVVLLLAWLLALTPAISRRTVPLGVSVPSERVDDPVVTSALAGYRRTVWLGAAVVLVATALLDQVDEALGLGLGPLLMLVVGAVALVRHRRPILAAKRDQDWYAGLPVRLTASVTPTRAGRPAWGYHVAAAVVALGGLAYGVSVFDQQPDPFPTHTGPSGMPDAWGPRTYANVLGGQLVALGMVALLALVAWAMTRAPVQVRPDGDVEGARRRALRGQRLAQSLLGVVNLVTAAGVTALELATWHALEGAPMQLLIGAFVVATLVPTVVMVARTYALEQEQGLADYRRAKEARARGERPSPESPDDDRHWRWGMVYDNPDDPRTFVPKRMGIGTTVNLGTAGGKAFYAGTALVIVGSLLLPVLLG